MVLRAALVMLLLLNAGAALWWWLQPAAPPTRDAATDRGIPGLSLVTAATPLPQVEAIAPAAVAEQPVPVADASAADPARCLRLGPFADAPAMTAARTAAASQVTRSAIMQRPARQGRGWRVFLPPQPSREQAQALVQRIQAAGVRDYYIIADGEQANGIALGLYGNEAAARSRQASLQAAGFNVRAEAVPPQPATQWLDVQLQPTADPAALARLAPARRIDCGAFGKLQGTG